MISINDALKAGADRLRLDRWANTEDHIKIAILKDPQTGEPRLGPWCELWSPVNEELIGRNPVQILAIGADGLGDLDAPIWTIYVPPK